MAAVGQPGPMTVLPEFQTSEITEHAPADHDLIVEADSDPDPSLPAPE